MSGSGGIGAASNHPLARPAAPGPSPSLSASDPSRQGAGAGDGSAKAAERSVGLPCWPRGSYNHQIIVLGVNECGKTTRARSIALSHAAQGVRIFIHDPARQFGGWPMYSSPKAWHEAQERARQEQKPFPLIARFGKPTKPIDCLRLGTAMAARSGLATPSLVIMDEGSALYGKARRDVFDEEFLELVTQRRHFMTGIVILSQWVTMLHYLLIANSTELHLMRIKDARQVRYLSEFLDTPAVTLLDGRQADHESLLQAIPRLGRGECYPVRMGFGEEAS